MAKTENANAGPVMDLGDDFSSRRRFAMKDSMFKSMKKTFGLKSIQIGLFSLAFLAVFTFKAQPIPGIHQTDQYVPLLTGKNVGVVANQTSKLENVHLVDLLMSKSIQVKKVFAPEHGFRGKEEAGAHIKDGTDSKTGLPVISLYGKNKKPSFEQLEGLDAIVFDIQDVGARFYTYISTLTLVMEACAENGIELIVLDRPNPNGHYIDGPILEVGYESFVGMHRVPVVYGMTIGEYAVMVNGEDWLSDNLHCSLTVILCEKYDHTMTYDLPIKPSPNLPNNLSIKLYPSLCFFEGTLVSAGRGTDLPFQLFGSPWLSHYSYTFTPQANEGSKNPKFKGELCYGFPFNEENSISAFGRINLEWLIDSYNRCPDQERYFNSFFDKLAGNSSLRESIISGKKEEEIRKSWESDLEIFKAVRSKYLLYPDFKN